MIIRWIGQSGYVIRTDTTEIMIDPYLSDVVNRVANRPRLVETPIKPGEVCADGIICTHNHLDHLDVDAVMEMNPELRFITTQEGKANLLGIGFENVQVLNVNDHIVIGDIEIVAVYAKHTVEAFGIVVKAEGYTLYFSGDTLYDEKLFEIAKFQPDIAFLCINGKLGNMNVDEAALTAKKIGARVNVPNHYGMFASNTENPLKFTKQISNGFVMDYNREYCIEQILK